jgi:outer membrane protein assembly factor BamB
LLVAFHKDTGKELWRALKANDPGYSSPVICQLGGQRQLICWHTESINGLDPETGKVYWSQPFKVSWAVATPRATDNRLLVSSLYHGSLMLEFQNGQPAPAVLWQGKSRFSEPKRTDGLHSFLPTPLLKDGFIYGVCSYGQLRCLNAATGERIWESLQLTGTTQGGADRWNNAFLVTQGDRCFFFTEKGDLVIGKLTPQGYEETSRTHLLKPDQSAETRNVTWAHPAFANQCIYARNNSEIICVSLAAANAR